MKLSVHLVTWNGAKYIPYLFESLRTQTFSDWQLYVLDNASKDDTVVCIKKELQNFLVSHSFQELKENTGFAGGHNFLFRTCTTEYVLLLNQDMYLAPDCLQNMVNFLDTHPSAAAVSPRLMKWNFSQMSNGQVESSFSDTVDSLGLKIFRHRQVIEQYTAQVWDGIKNHFSGSILPVFGVSGAFPMFRLTAVKGVAYADGTLFDSSYGSYKEDVDLAYRLTATRYESFVLLDTVAYHDRTGAGPKTLDDKSMAENHKKLPSWVRYQSYKNHLMTIYKNEYWQNFLLDFPWILWYELKKFGWNALFEPKVVLGLFEVWKLRKSLGDKRMLIQKKQMVSWQKMRQYWK